MKVQPRVDNFSQLIDRLLSVHELSDVLEKVGKQSGNHLIFYFLSILFNCKYKKEGLVYHSQS